MDAAKALEGLKGQKQVLPRVKTQFQLNGKRQGRQRGYVE
jgi:hypothetical protein